MQAYLTLVGRNRNNARVVLWYLTIPTALGIFTLGLIVAARAHVVRQNGDILRKQEKITQSLFFSSDFQNSNLQSTLLAALQI